MEIWPFSCWWQPVFGKIFPHHTQVWLRAVAYAASMSEQCICTIPFALYAPVGVETDL